MTAMENTSFEPLMRLIPKKAAPDMVRSGLFKYLDA
jgi:hypothetical protein